MHCKHVGASHTPRILRIAQQRADPGHARIGNGIHAHAHATKTHRGRC